MLIGIDGNEANVAHRVGSNIYAYELLVGIHKLVQSEKLKAKNHNLKFKVYLKNLPLKDLPKANDWWQYRQVFPRQFSTRLGLPLKLFFQKPRPDVFFTPGHYVPAWSPCPIVMAIMDLSYIHFPDMFRRRDLLQLRNWTKRSVRKSQRILTISQFTKNAIIGEYRQLSRPAKRRSLFREYANRLSRRSMLENYTSPMKWRSITEERPIQEKVVVTHLGFRMKKTKKGVDLRKYGVEGEFILYVGTLQPRKNIEKLIDAFALLTDRDLQLVLVGKKGWLYDQIFAKVKKMGLTDRVVFTGFVPDEDLPAFYQKSLCFVLVSLYEGFGLPVLEAMAHDCPVVASNVSSLPEVAGDAGVLVDPKSVKSIARGIEKAIKNRESLIKKGRKQVKKFSWEKCARETLAVLEEVGKTN